MFTTPPPSGGAALMFIINIMKGYDINPCEACTPDEALLWHHRLMEATKFALTHHSQLADDNVVHVQEVLENMTSEGYAEEVRLKINDSRTQDEDYYGCVRKYPDIDGTSHVSVIDQYGNGLALTSSINSYFGSGVYGSRTGIIFNDGMNNFLNIDKADDRMVAKQSAISPGKRPLSAKSPAIFTDQTGNIKLVVGSAGGIKIIPTNAMIAMDTLWFNRDIEYAVTKPRLSYSYITGAVLCENTFDEDIADGLRKLGHNVKQASGMKIFSVANAILRKGDGLYTSPDNRKPGGYPAGF
ncbi:glutathione hydrolase 1 proenzyme-like [Ptychodera flava]|uniref:glutathione hydrolase 1 proenzyme-like n=1 Tax=Ptychodera flava TaxID=63121 RepID=UPI00396A9398